MINTKALIGCLTIAAAVGLSSQAFADVSVTNDRTVDHPKAKVYHHKNKQQEERVHKVIKGKAIKNHRDDNRRPGDRDRDGDRGNN